MDAEAEALIRDDLETNPSCGRNLGSLGLTYLVGTRRGRVITFQAVIWRDPGVGPAADGPGMGIYDFEVLKDDTVIAATQAIALPDARAAWPKVAELAKTFNQPWAQNPC